MTRFRSFFFHGLIAVAIMAAVTTLNTGDVRAADALEQGPKVGEPIPHRLTAPDQSGQMRNFRSLKRERGLILLFTRSLDW